MSVLSFSTCLVWFGAMLKMSLRYFIRNEVFCQHHSIALCHFISHIAVRRLCAFFTRWDASHFFLFVYPMCVSSYLAASITQEHRSIIHFPSNAILHKFALGSSINGLNGTSSCFFFHLLARKAFKA